MAKLTRRGFLQASSTAASLSALSEAAASDRRRAKSCIVLFLVGGPSQLETFDPKPDAPADVRGPFGSIATSVPGVRFGEHLPRLASLAHRVAVVRSVHHSAAPVHETGQQLLQTGRLGDYPHFGAVLGRPFVVLPNLIGNTGISISHGQEAGSLGAAHEPTVQANFTHHLQTADRERYGKTAFGDACLRSRQLVEAGTRTVVVNMFETVYDRVTWDCHADQHCLSSTLDDYRRTLCPTFDRACSTLLDDLQQRGMLADTLVVAMGEFGRTPRLNAEGGRDHWPGCWSILLAGGGVRGGQVIGASDRIGAEPARRPVACSQVPASIYYALGAPTPTFVTAEPIRELFV